MFKFLAQALLHAQDESTAVHPVRRLDKTELQSLFRDDFAAHAMIVRSRKAARRLPMQMAA